MVQARSELFSETEGFRQALDLEAEGLGADKPSGQTRADFKRFLQEADYQKCEPETSS